MHCSATRKSSEDKFVHNIKHTHNEIDKWSIFSKLKASTVPCSVVKHTGNGRA